MPPMDTSLARYAVSDAGGSSTPPIQKFVYDHEVVDIGYVPVTDAYAVDYSRP